MYERDIRRPSAPLHGTDPAPSSFFQTVVFAVVVGAGLLVATAGCTGGNRGCPGDKDLDPVDEWFDVTPPSICGRIDEQVEELVALPKVEYPLSVSSFTAPRDTTTYVYDRALTYKGPLVSGNTYGSCEVVIAGRYCGIDGAGHDGKGQYTARSTLSIAFPNPPRFFPAALNLAPGAQERVSVKVTPPCTYEVVFAHRREGEAPSGLQVLPTILVTDADGVGEVSVRDLTRVPRGPIVVDGMIRSSQGCAPAEVQNSFTVTVGGG